jgi:SAM-dependent methyltransferase
MESMQTLEAAQRESRERLFPTLTNPSWLILRRRREIFRKWLESVKGESLAVLDVGGRIQPYRELLEGRLGRYVAVDLRRSPMVNLVADGAQIPFATAAFDLVFCTQVLEYVQDPSVVMAEIRRVLKPGGLLMMSAPAIFPRDSDQDTWRFLPQSLRILLRPFAEVEIVAEGSSIAGFFRTACVCLQIFARFELVRAVFRFTLIPLLNLVGFCLESLLGNSNDQFTANYSVRARK